MKMKIAFTLITLLAGTAFANDGGIPYINVNSMKSKLPDGTHIRFKGGEAFKLYNVLPQDFVYDVSRSITITSNGRSMSINCLQQDTRPGDHDPAVGDPKTTECSVSLGQAYDPSKDEGDSFNWEPRECKQR